MATLQKTTLPTMSLPPFDELVRLAKEDPQALENLRHQHTEALIQAASPSSQPHLRALQSHIERTIATSRNPLHSCVLLNRLIMRQLSTLKQVLNHPNEFMAQNAKILSFNQTIAQPMDTTAAPSKNSSAQSPEPRT